MWKKIALTIGGILALFFGYVAIQPTHYEISRQVTINASADKIFPYLNSSKLGEKWSPWLEMDPKVKMAYSGPDAGVGSRSDWIGREKLGTGSATISKSIPNSLVGVQLDYKEPMVNSQYAEYILRPDGDATAVTWRVEGENNFLGRIICTFMNMDKMIGGTFEKGLGNLKAVIEKKN